MSRVRSVFETHDVEETVELGIRIGRGLPPGAVILLNGDLGSGKTVLARGIAKGLGVPEWRGSPTFNIVHEYEGRMRLHHIDAYRIDANEFIDLDVESMVERETVLIVEWGAKIRKQVRSMNPRHLLAVEISDRGGNRRHIELDQ